MAMNNNKKDQGFGEIIHLYTVNGNIKCFSLYGKWNETSSKLLKIELPNDWATSLLSIYLKQLKTESQRYIRTPMFIVALFTIAKIQKQSNVQWPTNG